MVKITLPKPQKDSWEPRPTTPDKIRAMKSLKGRHFLLVNRYHRHGLKITEVKVIPLFCGASKTTI